MAAFFANLWFTADGNSFVTVSTDEVGVTCRLLAGLKQKTDAAGVKLFVYLQYGGPEVVDGSRMAAASRTASGGKFYELKRWIKTKIKPLLLNTPPGAPDWYEPRNRSANARAAWASRPSMSLPDCGRCMKKIRMTCASIIRSSPTARWATSHPSAIWRWRNS